MPASRGSSGPTGVTSAHNDSGQRTFWEFIGSLPRQVIRADARGHLQAMERSV
jgi:hypothetical protein